MPNKSVPTVSNIVISGATGLIGTALCDHLKLKGFHVRRLVRRRPKKDSRQEIYWNPDSHFVESAALENTDVVIHLSGQSIFDRWTAKQKKAILESRVQSTKLLSHAMARLKMPPKLFICASAVGFYGDRGDEKIDENSKPGLGFLAEVCRQWEEATFDAKQAGIPVVHMRNGIVLDEHGGALKKMLPIFRMGLGGVLGSGDQFMSWISIFDLVRAVEHIISQPHFAEGPFNLVSPHSITNKAFSHALADTLHRPCGINIPAAAIRLFFGQMGEELFLYSCQAFPSKLLKSGYSFQHAHIEEALPALLSRS